MLLYYLEAYFEETKTFNNKTEPKQIGLQTSTCENFCGSLVFLRPFFGTLLAQATHRIDAMKYPSSSFEPPILLNNLERQNGCAIRD